MPSKKMFLQAHIEGKDPCSYASLPTGDGKSLGSLSKSLRRPLLRRPEVSPEMTQCACLEMTFCRSAKSYDVKSCLLA